MPKKETKRGNGKVSEESVTTEESRWFVGSSLLNGGQKLKPELQAVLDLLTISVTQIVTDHGPEPMICLKGPTDKLNALAAIAKGKLAL